MQRLWHRSRLITFEVFQVDKGEYRIANERPLVKSGISDDILHADSNQGVKKGDIGPLWQRASPDGELRTTSTRQTISRLQIPAGHLGSGY
jgi:hypothetical protein